MPEAFPKPWRKGTEVSGRGGVTQWNLRKEPKIRIGLSLLRGRERALETFGKSRRSGRLGLLEETDCLDGASEGWGGSSEQARAWGGLSCRKNPNL